MTSFTAELVTERLRRHQNSDFKWSNLNGNVFDNLGKSSILVPLLVEDGEVFVLLTMRSHKLKSEGGHVSFPGGIKDSCDKDEIETCLRESDEEIGLKPKDINIVCQFLPWITKREKSDLLVTPVAGILHSRFKPKISSDEVEFTFCLPLRRFLNKDRHTAIPYNYKGARFCMNFFTDNINDMPVVTWGLTAGVCVQVAVCVLQELPSYQWVPNVPRPQLHDPFLDWKQCLKDLESTYSLKASTYENNLQEIMAYQSLLYPLHASGGYFGLAFATPPPPRVERLSTLMLSAEATLVSFTKFVGYLQWEMPFFTSSQLKERITKFNDTDYAWKTVEGTLVDKFLKAAILIPLFLKEGKVYIWLTERAKHLRNDGGHVAFPGGKKDDSDQDEKETCLRESYEEIGLKAEQVEIIGQLLPRVNSRLIFVTPVVGLISPDFTPDINKDEVEATFYVPLDRFLSSRDHRVSDYYNRGIHWLIHYFDDCIEGKTFTTWGLTAALCVEIAMCVYHKEPEFEWTLETGMTLDDPLSIQRIYLNKLEKTLKAELNDSKL